MDGLKKKKNNLWVTKDSKLSLLLLCAALLEQEIVYFLMDVRTFGLTLIQLIDTTILRKQTHRQTKLKDRKLIETLHIFISNSWSPCVSLFGTGNHKYSRQIVRIFQLAKFYQKVHTSAYLLFKELALSHLSTLMRYLYFYSINYKNVNKLFKFILCLVA